MMPEDLRNAELGQALNEPRDAEDALRAERERLQVTLASIGDGVIVVDEAGRVTFLNVVAEQLTGWPLADAAGRPLEEIYRIVNEATRAEVENPVERVLREGQVIGLANHTVLIARDGTERPIDDSAAPIAATGDRLSGVVLVFRDVTERRRTEEALKASEARKAAVLETALDAIVTIDAGGRVVEFNPAAERIFGYRRGDVMGREIADLIVPPSLRTAHHEGLARYLASGESRVLGRRIEITAQRSDGTEFPVELALTRISTDGPPAFTAHVRDISDRKRAEERLVEQTQAVETLHRIGTALAAELDLERVVQLVTDEGRRLTGAAFGAFFYNRIDEQGESYTLYTLSGVPREVFEQFPMPRNTDVFGPTFRGEGVIRLADVTADARYGRNVPYRGMPEGHLPVRSYLAVPVASRSGEVVGGLFFGHPDIGRFSERHERLAVGLAGQASIAIDNARLYEAARRELEKAAESEERLRLALEAGHMGTWGWDIATDSVTWSPTLEEIFGVPPGGFPRNFDAYASVLHPEDRPHVLDRVTKTLNSGGAFRVEHRVIWPDGTVHWIEGRGKLFVDEEGNPVRMAGVCMDIDRRKRGEQNAKFLTEASVTLAGLVDFESTLQKVAGLAVPTFADWCAVDLVDEEGDLRRVALTHVDAAKVELGRELTRRYPPRKDVPRGAYQVLRTGEAEYAGEISGELLAAAALDEEHLRILHELGLKTYICVPLQVRGRTIGVMTFIGAESGRRYDEQDMELARELSRRAAVAIENARLYRELRDADRRKDEFLAMLAHELRNPLAPIRNALALLASSGIDAETAGEARDVMDRQVDHLVRLVDDLLDVSRIMRGRVELRKEPVELRAVLDRAIEASLPLIRAQEHTFEVVLPDEPVWLDADPVRLAQIFANLLGNAAKYTEPGGNVTLCAELREGGVFVRVRDTGIGIEPGLLTRIFELFAQSERSIERSQGGLGIGLSLVKALVELHGGAVTAESDGPGRGSAFCVTLPTIRSPARPRPVLAEPAAVPVRPLRVLIVEDMVASARLMATMLKRFWNHDVRVAHDGVSALEAAVEFLPEVVLLDIGLPGMSGYDVAHRLRQRPEHAEALLVAVTGYGQEQDRRQSADAGFDEHLVKPASVEDLRRVFSHPRLVAGDGRPAPPGAPAEAGG